MISSWAAAAGSASLAAQAAGSANDVTPGLIGFVVIAAMGVALFFLLRSMNKHLRRVREVRDAGLEPGSKPGTRPGPGSTGGGEGRNSGGRGNGEPGGATTS